MKEIYWITRLDLISGWLTGFAVVCGIIIFTASIFYLGNKDDYESHQWEDSKNWMDFCSRIFKISLPSFFILVFASILTPTTKDAMLIYGVGTTIDYIKENDMARQLPDKCIKALDEWVESLSDNNNDSNNK